MSYKLYEHEKAEKFLYKHKNDKKLLLINNTNHYCLIDELMLDLI